jgi:hypothetical protein
MTSIQRSDWIFRLGALILLLCDATTVAALSEQRYLKQEAPVTDLLAALTALALHGLPDKLAQCERRSGSRARSGDAGCGSDARQQKAWGVAR